MTTYHPPNSAGPGTYLPLPQFKVFWGANWEAVAKLMDARIASKRAELKYNTTVAWDAYWKWHKTIENSEHFSFGSASSFIQSFYNSVGPYSGKDYKLPKGLPTLKLTLANTIEERPQGFAVPNEEELSRVIKTLEIYRPYTPPAGWQLTLSKVASKVITSTAYAAVGGALIAQATTLGNGILNDLLGDENMSFIDTLEADVGQVSSLVGKAKNTFGEVKSLFDFGNAGSTGIGPSAPPMQGPPTAASANGSSVPPWVWIVGGLGLAWMFFRK